MAHYYTDNKDLKTNRKEFTYYFDDEVFRFTTDNGVFSKGNIDYGSYVLIKSVYQRHLGDSLLDLGCGYGPIGIIMKRFNNDLNVEMVDVNSRATELALLNCQNNRVNIRVCLCEDILTLDHKFDTILLNPPIRAGKSVIYGLYEKSKMILNENGCLYIVIQKKQGAQSSKSKLETLFNCVKVIEKDGGYQVIEAHD